MVDPDDIRNNIEIRPYNGDERLEIVEGEDIEMLMIWHRKYRKPPPVDADPYQKELFREDEERMKPRAIVRIYSGPKTLFTGEASVEEVNEDHFHDDAQIETNADKDIKKNYYRVLSKWEALIKPTTTFPLEVTIEFEILKQERSWHDICIDIFNFDFSERCREIDQVFHDTLKRPVVPDPPRLKVPCTILRPFHMQANVDEFGKFSILLTNNHPTKQFILCDIDAYVDPDYLHMLEFATWNWKGFIPPPIILQPQGGSHSLHFNIQTKFKPYETDDSFGVFLEITFRWHDNKNGQHFTSNQFRSVYYRPPISCRIPSALQTTEVQEKELELKEKDPNFFHGIPIMNLDQPNQPIPKEYNFPKSKEITRTRAKRNQGEVFKGAPNLPPPPPFSSRWDSVALSSAGGET
uniref:Uncharacterized protein n=1 Tax=Aureoumbra lagunensis TaxID=44058 RepID=A0A7S3NLK3_9STRA|mmetsp:Transcript_11156/g.16743  ORF Transcript_11156/g.16743 Transcript_11156/m.16743 type:complete len:408 (-) Transcript_11156:156-1379(-)